MRHKFDLYLTSTLILLNDIIIMNSVEIENGIIHIYKNDDRLAKVIDASEKCRLKPKKDYLSYPKNLNGRRIIL
ncbi:MAG: hypothetical protein ACYCVH_09780 [Ignavibacteriaceae bacterium]